MLQYVSGQQPEMIKDINNGTASSYIIYMTTLGNKVIFKATNHEYSNNEPWVTDGTPDGTIMLREINPSTVTGSSMFNLLRFNNDVLFSANDGVNGSELWKTDGTSSGTVMVKDIAPGNTSSQPGELILFKGAVYFSAYHPDTGTELWKTLGTEESTVLVANITEGAASTKPGYLFATTDKLYFIGLDNHNLYVSDGTEGGTILLSDDVTIGQLDNAFFTEYNGEVYFRGTDLPGSIDGKGTQLWKVTAGGVQRVTAIVTGDNSTVLDPCHLTVSAGKLFFTGEEYPYGNELWAYDGITAAMVKDINPSGHGNLGGFLISYSGKLFFSAGDATTGVELWISDGTESGTKPVKDIYPGNISSGVVSPVIIGDTLFFSANNGTGGEIWMLTSPESQPQKFTDIPDGGAESSELVRISKTYFFNAGDATYGTELWKMNISSSDIKTLNHDSRQLRVKPNPVRDHFIVEIPEDFTPPLTLSIYNATGLLLLLKEINTLSPLIDKNTIELKPGIYILEITSGRKKTITKIVVSGD